MKHGGKYFISKYPVGKAAGILYMADKEEDLLGPKAKIFLDPNTMRTEDGTGTVVYDTESFSGDGKLMAYSISDSGSDWKTIKIREVGTGRDFPDALKGAKFAYMEWTKDNKGFFYTRYPIQETQTEDMTSLNLNEKVYYHRVGESQDRDTLIAELPDHPDWGLGPEVSDDKKYLMVSVSQGDASTVYYAEISHWFKDLFGMGGISRNKKIPLKELIATPGTHAYITNDGHNFYFITDHEAPNFRFVRIDLRKPEPNNWKTLIPEHPKDVLNMVAPIDDDKILVSYMHDVKSTLDLRSLKDPGRIINTYSLEAGSVGAPSSERKDKVFYFHLSTFTNPGTSYKLDFTKGVPRTPGVFRKTGFTGVDTNLYETNQVFYTSKDGTRVPMFLVQRKGYVPTSKGPKPVLLYGYGGFQVSMEPFFDVGFLSFVHMFDGIVAVANIRGGGEYGSNWYDQGHHLNKQNTYDDFHAAAEYLVEKGYTNQSKLAIMGESDGGVLVSTCVNQRPDLYAAGIAHAGSHDMFRAQKFTVGESWCAESGCSDNQTEFNYLAKYSPLHNIKENTVYPAVLVTCGDHDDRVVPLHSYKYTAQLQYVVGNYKEQKQPLLLSVMENTGHNPDSTEKQIAQVVVRYAFLQRVLGLNYVAA